MLELEQLAEELNLTAAASAEEVVAAYTKACEACRSTIESSGEKVERRMAKQKLRELEGELGPSVERARIRMEVDTILAEVEDVSQSGVGSVVPYFDELAKLVPQLDDHRLERRIKSLEASLTAPPPAPAPVEASQPEPIAAEPPSAGEPAEPEPEPKATEGEEPEEEAVGKPEAADKPEPAAAEVGPPMSAEPVEPELEPTPEAAAVYPEPEPAEEETEGHSIAAELEEPEEAAPLPPEPRVEVASREEEPERPALPRLADCRLPGTILSLQSGGMPYHLVFRDSCVFGRSGQASCDVGLPIDERRWSESSVSKLKRSISRRHFQIVREGSHVFLHDGAESDSGEHKRSAGGIFIDGKPVFLHRLDTASQGLLTLISPELRPERPALEYHWVPHEGIDPTVQAAFDNEGEPLLAYRSLLLERMEGYRETIVFVWGSLNARHINPKWAGVRILATERGAYIYSEAEGLLKKSVGLARLT